MSNDTSARDSGDRRMEKPAVGSKGGAMTIEEFESGLIQLGFRQSSRNRAAYQKKKIVHNSVLSFARGLFD